MTDGQMAERMDSPITDAFAEDGRGYAHSPGARICGSEIRAPDLLAVWPAVRYLMSLCLSFLIRKGCKISIPISVANEKPAETLPPEVATNSG